MTIATVNPATGETVETFAPHDNTEVARRIAEAADAAAVLRDTTFAQRAEWMNATADIMEADVEQAARMLTLEMGKPIGQARAEVLKCAKNMRFYAEHAESFLADEPLGDPSTVSASQAWTVWQPLGCGARGDAVELPTVAGHPVRRARADGGQHGTAQARFERAAVRAVP